MADHQSMAVQQISEIVADHMDAILKLFKPGAKITVLVRSPAHPDGSRDFVLANDTIDAAISALALRKTQPTLTGEV